MCIVVIVRGMTDGEKMVWAVTWSAEFQRLNALSESGSRCGSTYAETAVDATYAAATAVRYLRSSAQQVHERFDSDVREMHNEILGRHRHYGEDYGGDL